MSEDSVQPQKTIAKPVSYTGVGLHTGHRVTVKFRPAAPGSGIRFRRVDLPGKPEVKADVPRVSCTRRGTTIRDVKVSVHTVEHVLAALAGLGLDNMIIEIDDSEPPAGDGSSLPFVQRLTRAGIRAQSEPREFLEIGKPIWFSKDDVHLVALPADEFSISCTIDYNHPFLKAQFASFVINVDTFADEIAPARTFGFFNEVDRLRREGLIRGGSLANALVIGPDGILNEGLRFDNEFVRHKILDLIGDLSLLARPIKAHIIAIKSGHASNIELARKLRYNAECGRQSPEANLAIGGRRASPKAGMQNTEVKER